MDNESQLLHWKRRVINKRQGKTGFLVIWIEIRGTGMNSRILIRTLINTDIGMDRDTNCACMCACARTFVLRISKLCSLTGPQAHSTPATMTHITPLTEVSKHYSLIKETKNPR